VIGAIIIDVATGACVVGLSVTEALVDEAATTGVTVDGTGMKEGVTVNTAAVGA